jgi:toxin-antitoxin system PIN domain toxin
VSALVDVNVLVAAHRADHPHHVVCRDVLDGDLRGGFAWCAHTRNGFLRLVTHPGIFASPTPIAVALAAWAAWSTRGRSEALPDTRDSDAAFADLCRRQSAAGNAVYDLHLAALAMTHDRDLISLDGGFARIHGLRWRHLLGR